MDRCSRLNIPPVPIILESTNETPAKRKSLLPDENLTTPQRMLLGVTSTTFISPSVLAASSKIASVSCAASENNTLLSTPKIVSEWQPNISPSPNKINIYSPAPKSITKRKSTNYVVEESVRPGKF